MTIYFSTWKAKDAAELSADDLDRLITDRGREVDRLLDTLDDIMLAPAKRKETTERILAIQDELRRADIAKRKLARRG